MIAFLGIYVLSGLYVMVVTVREIGYETSNPYLLVSPLRIVWVVFVPVCWIELLRSRRVREWAGGAGDSEPGVAKSS